jgi:hypothetical protein
MGILESEAPEYVGKNRPSADDIVGKNLGRRGYRQSMPPTM